ncbi:MAG: hypothetical protein ACK56F_31365, partial [bacterium]
MACWVIIALLRHQSRYGLTKPCWGTAHLGYQCHAGASPFWITSGLLGHHCTAAPSEPLWVTNALLGNCPSGSLVPCWDTSSLLGHHYPVGSPGPCWVTSTCWVNRALLGYQCPPGSPAPCWVTGELLSHQL